MQAITIDGAPAAAKLLVRDVPDPVPGPDDLIVEVRASALNRADLRHAPSHFASSEARRGPAIGGLEMAGRVVALGDDVREFAVGTPVMAMTGGSWAQRVKVNHHLVLPVPDGFTWAQAAATPISFITAHDALVSAAALSAGERVLVRGATSAAGLAAIQIARELGARAFGSTNSPAKLPLLSSLGCVGIDSSHGGIAATIRQLTDDMGVDVLIDIVGAGVVQDNIDATAVSGRIVCLGRLAGTEGTFNLDEFSRKRIHMIGVTFRTRTFAERASAVRKFRAEMFGSLSAGVIHPIIDRVFSLHEIEDAENYMGENHSRGKIVIEIAQD
jgi:NADPH:quinone reductase